MIQLFFTLYFIFYPLSINNTWNSEKKTFWLSTFPLYTGEKESLAFVRLENSHKTRGLYNLDTQRSVCTFNCSAQSIRKSHISKWRYDVKQESLPKYRRSWFPVYRVAYICKKKIMEKKWVKRTEQKLKPNLNVLLDPFPWGILH